MKRLTFALFASLAMWFVAPTLAQTPPPQTTTQQTTTTTTTTVDRDPNADIDDLRAYGPNHQYGDPMCGTWANGVWQDNRHCPGYAVGRIRARIAGTITAVSGHLVTVQQTDRSVVINDQPALNRKTSGRVAVGRQIVAYGYWRDNNFYATVLE
ncbi:MAG TPA: hypothetical protein VNF68_13170 [Candidatus Baltobacteraceae bacterium]|nr:hypothetical protein [Candidatus Baltobacteraceae bacterium]